MLKEAKSCVSIAKSWSLVKANACLVVKACAWSVRKAKICALLKTAIASVASTSISAVTRAAIWRVCKAVACAVAKACAIDAQVVGRVEENDGPGNVVELRTERGVYLYR